MEVKRASISRLCDFEGKQAELAGWLYRGRGSGKVLFLMIRDGSGLCQCVVEKANVSDELFDELKHLGQESSLIVSGDVRRDERSVGGYEMNITEATIVQKAEGYPITPKPHGIDFLMKNRHLHLRSQRQWAIGKIRHTVVNAMRQYFNDNDFTLIDTPMFTTIAGEGEQTLFEVDYFGEPLHLTQTGQLYLENAAMAYGKVYCFGPTFRAEKSKTRRHLTEFWMVEPEIAYTDLDGLLDVAEKGTVFIVEQVLKNNRAELELLGADIATLETIKGPFYRLTYTEAVEILTGPKTKEFMEKQLEDFITQKKKLEARRDELTAQEKDAKKQWQKDKIAAELIEIHSELSELDAKIENNPKHAELAANFKWGKDLGGSDETIISMMYDKPVFVTHYPRDVRAFYMKPDPANPKVVQNFDMLAPNGFGEIIGGSMREDSYEAMMARIEKEDYNPESYWWYTDLRKYGSVPHGGYGQGVERTIAWITGERHIRQCIAFPRMMDKVVI